MAKTIALLGALDTKGNEYAFVRQCIEGRGHRTLVIDVGVLEPAALAGDVPRDEVARAGGADRLEAAARRGVPAVVAPGCLDMVNFWAPETIPEKFRGRKFYPHNPNITLMRTTPEENRHLADILVAHMGLTTAGSIGAKTAKTLDDCAAIIDRMAEAAKAIRPDILVLCHGGPIAEPDDANYILKRCQGVDGFCGASSMERLPTERAIREQTERFTRIRLRRPWDHRSQDKGGGSDATSAVDSGSDRGLRRRRRDRPWRWNRAHGGGRAERWAGDGGGRSHGRCAVVPI